VALKTKLAEVFGKDTLAALRTQVLIPAVSLTAGETLLFRNAADDPTRTRLAVDVAMATSAAPVFLPPHAADERLYADGGLVANSPESVAAADALSRRRWTRGRTSMLVVGSTRKDARVAGHQMAGRWGLSDWGLQLLDSTMASQMSLARQMAQHILGADNHFVVEALLSPADEKVVDLDKATPKATQALKTLAAEAYTRFERDEAALLEQLAGA
jgi:patatin-like phospholipase/acyl hydrolase